jgi:anti-sigma factor RsiW
MTELACAWVRDRLPEHTRDALDVADAARLEQHVATCEECSAEAAIVRLLAQPVAVPEVTATRVLDAVRSSGARPRGGLHLRHFALAASFAFAVIAGSLLWQRTGPSSGSVDTADVDAVVALPVESDPLLHESGLQSLSEEELRTLLEDLES